MHAFLSLTSKDDLGPVHTYSYSFGKATFFLLLQKNSRPLVAFSQRGFIRPGFRIVFARPQEQANSADVIVYIFSH